MVAGGVVETMSVLFTDLVGSTALRSRVGDVAADELRRVHDALLSSVVVDRGGHVVKGTGDGILATFASAVEAVGAAVEMQQAVHEHGRRHPADAFEIRVGISLGDVSVEDEDVFGTPVIEAARLCDAAAAEQILVTDVVHVLARSRSGARFQPVGPLELKGLAEPLLTVEVSWDPSPDAGGNASSPFPAVLVDRGALPLTGRDAELERLQSVWKEVAEGSFAVVLLAGEPGAGKTRLAAEFARRAYDGGAVVLHGRCDEQLEAPFQPLVEAVRAAIGPAHGSAPEWLTGPCVAELAPVLPDVARLFPDLPRPMAADPETERFRMMAAFASLLSDIASSGEGAVLIMDDAQWSDRASEQVVRLLVRDMPPGLLVLSTYRTTDVDPSRPWFQLLGQLRREQSVHWMDVGALDTASVEALMAAAAGDDSAGEHAFGDLAETVTAETDGNAFFIGELLRHLMETGGVGSTGGRWQLTRPIRELGIPEGVRDVVRQRTAALHDEAISVLSVAAVAGMWFDISTVAAVHGDQDVVDVVVDRAVAGRLVAEERPGRFRFFHALVHATLYDSLSATRRARLHEQLAVALEHDESVDTAELARHWQLAAALQPSLSERAIDGFVAAGDSAVAARSPDTAISHYRQALDLASPGVRGVEWTTELSTKLGAAERQAGDGAYLDRLLDTARAALDAGLPTAAAAAILETDRGTMSVAGVVNEDLISLIEETLGHGERLPAALSVRLLALRVSEMAMLHDERRRGRAVEEALAAAATVDDLVAEAQVLSAVLYVLPFADQLDGMSDVATRLDQLRPELPPRQQIIALNSLILLAVTTGEAPDRPLRWIREATALADQLTEPALRCIIAFYEVQQRMFRDGLDHARRATEELVSLAGIANAPDFALTAEGFGMAIDSYRGAIAGEHIEKAQLGVAVMPEISVWRAVLAYFLIAVGRDGDAAEELDRLAERDFDAGSRSFGYVPALVLAAQVAAHVRSPHRRRLRQLLGGCATLAPSAGVPVDTPAYAIGVLDASLGDHDSAIDQFTAAIEVYDRIDAGLFKARAESQLARSLSARNRPGDLELAHELACKATEAADRFGLRDIADLSDLLH